MEGWKIVKLGNNIRRLRFENNEMSQQKLANKIGVTRMTIYSKEKGKYIPSTLIALKIAYVFKIPVEKIFFIDTKKEDKRG